MAKQAPKNRKKKKGVDLKFIAVVASIVVLGGGLIGGFFWMQMTRAPQRNAAMGDELMAEGKYLEAKERYGRAVNKAPNDPNYLKKMEAALLKIQPDSQTRSQQYFSEWVGILRQLARVTDGGRNVEAWKRYTDLLIIVDEQRGLADAAEAIQAAFPADDAAAQVEVRRLKAIAEGLRVLASQADQAQVQAVSKELSELFAADPSDARIAGWRLRLLLAAQQPARNSGIASRARAARESLQAAIDETARAQPGNPVPSAIQTLLLTEDSRSTPDADPAVLSAAVATLIGEVNAAAAGSGPFKAESLGLRDKRLVVEVLRRQNTPEARAAILAFLQGAGGFGGQNAIDFELARAEVAGDPVAASRRLRTLIDAPRPTVGLDALTQEGIKRDAAELLARVTLGRYADAIGKPEADAVLQELRAQIAELGKDPSGNPEMADVARGVEVSLASIDKDLGRVIELGLPLVNRPDRPSAEVAYLLGQAYVGRNEPGEALNVAERILRTYPDDGQLLFLKAQALAMLNRMAESRQIATRLQQAFPNDARFSRILEFIDARAGSGASPLEGSADPVVLALNRLIEQEVAGDRAGAMAVAVDLAAQRPDDARVAIYVAQLLVRAGQREAAVERFRTFLEANPTLTGLEPVLAAIGEADPLRRVDAVLAAESLTGEALHVRRIQRLTLELERARAAASTETIPDALAKVRGEIKALSDARTESLKYLRDQNFTSDEALEIRFVSALADKDAVEMEAVLALAEKSKNKFLAGALRGRRAMAVQDWAGAIAAYEAMAADQAAPLDVGNKLAMAYLSAGRVEPAQRLLAESYRRRPNDPEIARTYALILQRLGREREALEVLRAAARTTQGDSALRNAWLGAEALYGDKGTVVQTRRRLFRNSPGDLENIRQLAALLCVTPPAWELAIDSRGNPRISAAAWNAKDNREQQVELLRIRQEFLGEAQALTERLLSLDPDDFQAIAALASGLSRSGELERSAQTLESAAARAKPVAGSRMLLAAAEARGSLGDEAEFERVLALARAKAPTDDRLFQLLLGRLLSQRNRNQAAMEAFDLVSASCEAALAKDSDDLQARGELEMLLREKFILCGKERNISCMEQVVARLKALEAPDAPASVRANRVRREIDLEMVRADEQYARGDTEGQIATNQRIQALTDEALRLEPRDAHPLIVRSQLGRRMFVRTADEDYLDEALVAVQEAERVTPGAWPITMEAVRVYIARDEFDKATEAIAAYLRIDPESTEARSRLAAVYRLSGKKDAALAVWEDAIKTDPLRPDFHRAKGELLVEMRRLPEAGVAFEEAYRLAGRTDDMIRSIQGRLEASPIEARAILALLQGKERELSSNLMLRSARAAARYHSGLQQDALGAMRDMWRQNSAAGSARQPESSWFAGLQGMFPPAQNAELEAFVLQTAGTTPGSETATALSRAWLRTPDGAQKGLEWVDRALEDGTMTPVVRAATLSVKGQALGHLSRWDEAAVAFEQSLEAFPRNPAALNNLAFIEATQLGRADSAIDHARLALELAGGGNGELLDTLGVALLAAGKVDEASTRLEQAAELAPSAAIYLHQAQVAKARNQPKLAREIGVAARGLADSDAQRSEIDAFLASLPAASEGGATP